ncbi:ATP synthase F1 subunit delta [Leptolyngbya sp. PCC 6406]|uniref:ATP synthase F1 subunit delta n=1 Tax=Leptolyngbya sp. PCC 6406 TaxID=1173264 RepID=UPI0002ACEC3B|nr:ATP synthase F1 subunit delta [Leptolyngbya sp. PCC 6406]
MSSAAITAEVASPYAQALMGLAKDQGLADRFGEDASALTEILSTSEDLRQFLLSPLMANDTKKGVLTQVGADRFHPLFVSFLKLLVDKGRVVFVEGVLSQYQTLLRELNQTVLAEVIAAVDLTDEQQSALRERVLSMTGARQVDLSITIDPDLLGGVVIKVGSQIVDASLRGQLRRLGIQLSAAS